MGLENLILSLREHGARCADGGIAVGVCRQRSESYNSKQQGISYTGQSFPLIRLSVTF